MLRLIATRAVLVALPFGVYWLWREWARRSGREVGDAPWGWLGGGGLLLAGLSLMASVAFHPDNRGAAYVPAQAHPDGSVTPAGFDPTRPPPPAAPTAPNTAP